MPRFQARTIGGGAQDAFAEIVAEAMLREEQARRAQQQQFENEQSIGDRMENARRFDLGQAAEATERAERQRVTDFNFEKQRKADATAQNQQGVRRMLGEFVTQKGGALNAGDRASLQGMALTEDVDVPSSLLEPSADEQSADRLKQLEGELKLRQRFATGPQEQRQWVIDAQGAQQFRVPQPGDRKLDPVAERQQNGPASPDQASETAAEVARVARDLKDHAGLNSAFGVLDSRLPTMRQSTADAEGLRNTLTSLLTLENMGIMKGVLSDSDMKVLRQASSLLGNERLGEAAARAELERLIPIMERVSGGATFEEPPMGRTGAAPQQGPAVGETRVINGQRARWDGRGWLPVQ